MGIQGLAAYVNNFCLEDYELGDTDLVLDGNNIAYSLYINYANCNDLCGGDYDKYSQAVSDFFDDLHNVDIKPLVFLHGSCKESRVPTMLSRMSSKIKSVSDILSGNDGRIVPLLLLHVFVDVLRKKSVPHARCLFEADETIAVVAKALNCPVVSSASAFYVYNVLTVQCDTLISNMLKRSKNASTKTIHCKIYRLENLLNSFRGLNQDTLSLASIILCNDDIRLRETLHNFLRMRKRRCRPDKANMFQTTLNWLSKLTLKEAVTEILITVPIPMRQYALKMIEANVNRYKNPCAEIFTHLSIPEESCADYTREPYKYEGDISTLPYRMNAQTSTEHRTQYFMTLSDTILQWKQVPDERKRNYLNTVIRNQGLSIVCSRLTETVTVPLSTSRELSHSARKAIIDNVLGVKNIQITEEVLPEWQLYIACLKYWTSQTQQYQLPMRHGCIHSILICMLYQKTVSKIGYYSSLDTFTKSKETLIKSLMKERQLNNIKPNEKITLAVACEEIDTLDCLLAAPFFISNSQKQPEDPNVHEHVVQHAFAQFQFSLSMGICLNALLGFPYDEPEIANLYNGTLLYNLCTAFRSRKDLHTYKNIIFDRSPTLLRAYNVLLSKVKPLFF
ncbi:protein asteroid-like isoform X2 [Megalopta genalis]|uniref:protein asteroid-like isoform X2 n=1 Tax=Megalopta genalis TaxID=115081 RepID=UPI003FD2CD48